MTDEHVKGTVNRARGKVEEGLGKVARQVQGSAQKGLGNVQDADRKPKNRP
jgi:uncharacterized protein YjbJ (UPF0337 family)